MVRPAGWSGGGASPPVLPSRRGGIIGRQIGVTFKSKLTGSSPRVRGTARNPLLWVQWVRFIPACAGNSPPAMAGKRVNGGSSPRVRGTEWSRHRRSGQDRFIPACAGNSVKNRVHIYRCPVHPRVCGEQKATCSAILTVTGSSPRVRGTDFGVNDIGIFARFIPACAGNRHLLKNLPQKLPVHPRVCGEQLKRPARWMDRRGSSPRVRGTDPPVAFVV